jgi:hypothetical protein
MSLDKQRLGCIFAAVMMCGLVTHAEDAWAKKGGKGTSEQPAAPAETNDVALPADMNSASLRISALDMLYELDLSPEQLAAFAGAGATATAATRTPVKPNEKLMDLFAKMQAAILSNTDDQAITTLRNQIIDFVNTNNVELDDTVRTTAAAHAAAPALCNKLKASQIAAFLAMHADEVGDPEEMMLGALTTLRDARSNPDLVDGNLVQDTATSIGYLVAGMDDIKAKAITDQVAAWLKTGTALSDADFAAQHETLVANAGKMVNAASPMDVLTHWMQQQVAILLSNPEGTRAIRLMMNRKSGN